MLLLTQVFIEADTMNDLYIFEPSIWHHSSYEKTMMFS